jgi:hypothetical protein
MTTEDEEFNRIEREASMRKAAVTATVQKPMHPEMKKMFEDYFDKCFRASAQRHWAALMRGVRVEGDTVVITVKGGNAEARCLCGELINEMEMRT